MPEFNKDHPQTTGFPLSFDQVPIRLINNNCGHKTIFSDTQGHILSWDLLQNVTLTMIPLLHIRGLHIKGGVATLQILLESAIVTSVKHN